MGGDGLVNELDMQQRARNHPGSPRERDEFASQGGDQIPERLSKLGVVFVVYHPGWSSDHSIAGCGALAQDNRRFMACVSVRGAVPPAGLAIINRQCAAA